MTSISLFFVVINLLIVLLIENKKEGFRGSAKNWFKSVGNKVVNAYDDARRVAEDAANRVRQEAEAVAQKAKEETERIAREAEAALQRAFNGITRPINSLKSDFESIPNKFNELGDKISSTTSNINSSVEREMVKINDNIKGLGEPIHVELNNINNDFKSIPGFFDKMHVNFERPPVTINR